MQTVLCVHPREAPHFQSHWLPSCHPCQLQDFQEQLERPGESDRSEPPLEASIAECSEPLGRLPAKGL